MLSNWTSPVPSACIVKVVAVDLMTDYNFFVTIHRVVKDASSYNFGLVPVIGSKG